MNVNALCDFILKAGGVAGVCVDLILFPLDTVKTRLQSPQGFWKAGGFRGIYAGVPSTAIGSFPNGKSWSDCALSSLKWVFGSTGHSCQWLPLLQVTVWILWDSVQLWSTASRVVWHWTESLSTLGVKAAVYLLCSCVLSLVLYFSWELAWTGTFANMQLVSEVFIVG